MFRRRTLTEERGQAVAEFALVLPALCLILLAILQFGIVFKDYLALTDAVRAGARKAAVSRHESNPEAAAVAAVEAAATDLGDGLEVDVTSSWAPGTEVEVAATYPYEVRLLGVITVSDGRLHTSTKERVE